MNRVIRGSCWGLIPQNARVALRFRHRLRRRRSLDLGLRIARSE
jgi:hypothetical protein